MSEKVKNQLHQLLAVEQDRKHQGIRILQEAMETFTERQDHFDGIQKKYVVTVEGEQEIPPEIKGIVTTVGQKIEYAKTAISRGIDATISKEETNNSGEAVADLIVDGAVIKEKLSATSLLALETMVKQIRDMYSVIPTLDPVKSWKSDEQAGKGVYKTPIELKYRMVKKNIPIELAPATKEHPAQVQMGTEDKIVGKYETVSSSGRLTTAEKSKLLNRVNQIINAVKKARARANQAEVTNVKIGEKLFDFINKDIL